MSLLRLTAAVGVFDHEDIRIEADPEKVRLITLK
jgi:hypothetical protein